MAEGIDLVSPITTAGGLYPQLHTQIVQTAMPLQVARQYYQPYSLVGAQTNSISFAKQNGSTSVVFNQTEQGTLIPIDMTPYSFVNAVPYKISSGLLITRELIEDSMLPVVQDQLMRKAIILGNTVDRDCISTMISSVLSANSFNGDGISRFFDGTTQTIASTLGITNILKAIRLVKNGNYEPTDFFTNPTVEEQLRNLPNFNTLLYSGTGGVLTGAKPTIFGLTWNISANCVDWPTGTSNRAFVISRGVTANVNKQYSPMGYFVEKRPISTQIKEIAERDSQAVYITMRYVPVVLKNQTYAMISNIGSVTP